MNFSSFDTVCENIKERYEKEKRRNIQLKNTMP